PEAGAKGACGEGVQLRVRLQDVGSEVGGSRLDGFVAGDDEAAKQKALEFIESIGFRPLDAGPLAMARALEAMGLLNIVLQIRNNWPWQSGWKLAGPTADEE